MDESRRSNAKDAEYVEMPSCPKCGCANKPWASPMIELVGRVYVCSQCGTEFLPAATN